MHNVANALAAAGAALQAGADLTAIATGLGALAPVDGRGNWSAGLGGAQIIDDAYNANPASVIAAIDLLASLDGRRVLALGDMGELGEWAEQSHREVGEHARKAGLVDALYATGRLSALAVDALASRAACSIAARRVAALAPTLDANTRVLVKGSRSAGMDTVVAGLLAPADAHNNDNGAS
ncbi:cyanophycin synthetase [Halopseudomonas pachastrellae]|nr:cyanophycin synthetase [Halopseudomonas pachastrellae]